MSEDDYRSLEAFKDLPLFGESDPRCETIDKVNHDTVYTGEVFEADDLPLALTYMAQSDLVPRGGIRFHMGGTIRVFAYFWRKRP